MRAASALFAGALIVASPALTWPSAAQVAIGVSITVPPPMLPVYAQPPLPGPGYIWTPGYWAWGPTGYYWVPGTWVLPPAVGLLWTPGWWGWVGGHFVWHAGYWGPHVGFYGGVNYGFGYDGHGYHGGRWEHGHFAYNRAVTNIGEVHVANVYHETVVNRSTLGVSYNGGAGGLAARPSQGEAAIAHERHFPPSAVQAQHERAASVNRAQFASVNHGQPPVAAVQRPDNFGAPHGAPQRPAHAGHAGPPHAEAANGGRHDEHHE